MNMHERDYLRFPSITPVSTMPTQTEPAVSLFKHPHFFVYLKLIAVALLWGGTFIAGHILATTLPPMTAATGRFAVAVVLLLIWGWRTEGGLPRLNGRQLLLTFALGVSGVFLYNLCFFAALARLPAGRTALFVALNPIVTALLLALLLRERLGGFKWCGIVLALCGALIIVTRGDLAGAAHDISQAFGAGELYMLTAVTCWAAYTIVGRYALKSLSPLAATSYAAIWGLLLLGCGMLTELSGVQPIRIGWQALAAMVYLGAFGTVIGFVWYYQGVRAIGPSRTAIFNNLVPMFGVLLATVLLGETLLISMLAGGVLIILGVTMTNTGKPVFPGIYARFTRRLVAAVK